MKLTHQQILDRVWQHFIVEGNKPGFDENCRYMDEFGNRCAIGIFIPDEDGYRSMLGDECSVMDLQVRWPSEFETIFGSTEEEDMLFLSGLQDCHDKPADFAYDDLVDFTADMKDRLEQLAQDYNLSIPGS